MKDFELLSAGIELDTLIAVEIMGWSDLYGGTGEYPYEDGSMRRSKIKPYSTDLATAFEIEEMMRIKFNKSVSFHTMLVAENDVLWDVKFEGQKVYTRLSSLPHAICKAALLSVMDS